MTIAAVLYLAASPALHPAQELPSFTIAQVNDLTDIMMDKVVDRDVAGVTCLVGNSEGAFFFANVGKLSLEKPDMMPKDAIFQIYSMTKPITAATAMALVEEGKLSLDDEISKYLPEWKDVKVRKDGEVVKAEQPVTVRDLLTHSSGLNYVPVGIRVNFSLDEFSKKIADRPLNFEPGTSYQYGYSLDVMGRVIEVVSGMGLDEASRKYILDPCDMNETDYWVRDKSAANRIAEIHNKPDGELKFSRRRMDIFAKPARMMGGQGMCGTTQDYANFCQMLLNDGKFDGRQVLKKETVDLMFENHLAPIKRRYGLGGQVDGKGFYNWGGVAGTKFWVDKEHGYYGVIMLQRLGYQDTTSSAMMKLIHDTLRK